MRLNNSSIPVSSHLRAVESPADGGHPTQLKLLCSQDCVQAVAVGRSRVGIGVSRIACARVNGLPFLGEEQHRISDVSVAVIA
jgi:hypothetical protein